MRTYDWIEAYLEQADVECAFAPKVQGGGGHPTKFFAILKGGVGVIAKVADPNAPESVRQARREVAAYRLLGLLGWEDLSAVTVFRQLVDPLSGAAVSAAVQIMWPDNQPSAPLGEFLPDMVMRAAIFDVLMQHEDRGGQNWLGVPVGAVNKRLVLIDNGNSLRGGQVNSAFVNDSRGKRFPPHMLAALDVLISLLKGGRGERLFTHLEQNEQDIVLAQAEHLLTEGEIR